ncbi:helix-turn-helix domain-containing protein [Brucella gallinifaecis]|uniref:Helix-turn-helix domain-containing protein n=1 Tax=Brucella gallinifaecis TaxID=215590 RepID=A0A502BTH2_9HYPH|nr:helix-turn-helix domain-containing protein [Brucella gallinifaecis]TPF77140.1 helix-turn-helix domain-containing protein [Brucella gallinifaecis]
MLNTINLSTDLIEDRHKNDYWRGVTRPAFETIIEPGKSSEPLFGEISAKQLGDIVLGTTKFNAQKYVRDQRSISSFGLDNYIIQIVTSGTLRGDFNGLNSQACIGDISITDMAYTFQSEVSAGSRISLVLPRSHMQRSRLNGNIHGRILKSDDPLTAFLINCTQGFLKVSPHLNNMQIEGIQNSIIDMFALGLNGKEINPSESSTMNIITKQRILDYIDSNIENPALSTESIQKRFRISRSHLYRIFAEDEGVATVIRTKRLALAFKRLTTLSSSKRVHLAELAYQAGFSDYGSFSKLFQEKYGEKPTDIRNKAQQKKYNNIAYDGKIITYFKNIQNYSYGDNI